MITSGEGKYKVWLEQKNIGNDLLYVLGGGRLEGHYDDVVLKNIAEAACKQYKTNVVAVGGVHVDNATKDEIKLLIKNCNDLVKYI